MDVQYGHIKLTGVTYIALPELEAGGRTHGNVVFQLLALRLVLLTDLANQAKIERK